MKSTEARPVQLGLGERVIAEKKIVKGVIKTSETVIVPIERGYCYAKLAQDTEVEQVDGCRIWGLSGWRITTTIDVTKSINGDWKEWPIPEGSVIGAYSKQVRKRKGGKEFIIRKDFPFS